MAMVRNFEVTYKFQAPKIHTQVRSSLKKSVILLLIIIVIIIIITIITVQLIFIYVLSE
jgi:hypothetical protein